MLMQKSDQQMTAYKNKEQRNLSSTLSKSEKSDLKSNSNFEWTERFRILNIF